MARNSTSANDRETVTCFLERQDIKGEPKVTQKPVRDCLVAEQAPQSVSPCAVR